MTTKLKSKLISQGIAVLKDSVHGKDQLDVRSWYYDDVKEDLDNLIEKEITKRISRDLQTLFDEQSNDQKHFTDESTRILQFLDIIEGRLDPNNLS